MEDTSAVHPEVLQALRDWRHQEARGQSIPPYWILTNRMLADIATRLPRSREDLVGIPGMGPVRLQRYGDAILEAVTAHTGADLPAPERCDPVETTPVSAAFIHPTRVSYPIPVRYWTSVLTATRIAVPGTVGAMDLLIALTHDPS